MLYILEFPIKSHYKRNFCYSSQYITIHRGTWEGCTQSPIPFLLAFECFAIKLQRNPDIQRIYYGDLEHKCSIFVDYIQMLLSFLVTPIPNLCLVLWCFMAISGLKDNHSKSLVLNISLEDHTAHTLQNPFPFKWQQEALSYLVFL